MSLDAQILAALRLAGLSGVSGADLAQRLGVSRAAVWARMSELRLLGYEIVASPHAGYRLTGVPDVLHADDLRARLADTRVIGRQIQVFRETSSTSDVVEKLARDGVDEGAVVFAEAQTRGRGRLGRTWTSPANHGLWFSVLLRPVWRPPEVTRVTVAAVTAVARAVQQHTGVSPQIKWPNDLLLKGRKMAGILTELNAELDRVRYVNLGIGVNVNLLAEDFPPELRRTATSLRAVTGQAWNRADLAVAILRELDRDYARIQGGDFEAVAEEWAARCTSLGREVTIRLGRGAVRGRAECLDPDGALLVRTEHGRLERITGGDVSVEK